MSDERSEMATETDAYRAAGVDYSLLDGGKRMALAQALKTSRNLFIHGGAPLEASRGASAFVFQFAERICALVMEGLGTKSMIARQVQDELGEDHFHEVAYDTVAAIVNDLCSVGALPVVVNAYFATGSSGWYSRSGRLDSLLSGWREACDAASCVWGGGESPSLPGLVDPEEIELAGSAFGAVPDGCKAILGEDLAPGDEIVLISSSGLHANGASLVRALVAELPEGYRTSLKNGQRLGEAVLAPSRLYVDLVAALQAEHVPVTFMSHITGHGLLKIMRSPKSLTYILSDLPPVPEVLAFIAKTSGMDEKAAYSTLNMGCGYAVYCRPGEGARVVALAENLGHNAVIAGRVTDGPRQVFVEKLDIVYRGEEMVLAPGSMNGVTGRATDP
jgi:phosphoribosylformylglycinamidine cyclo-ligase